MQNRNRVEVDIDEGAVSVSTDTVRLIERAVDAILVREGHEGKNTVSVVVLLTSDEKLQQLNRDYAGDDYVTDVLSFEAGPGDDFPETVGDDGRTGIGDIAISVPQTERQAAEKSIPFNRELAMLAVHGTLHLLGYDHATPEEERIMFGKTDAALDDVFGS